MPDLNAPTVDLALTRQEIGIARSAAAAGDDWKREAVTVLRRYCRNNEYVFVDDLWEYGIESGLSDRAMGNVMQTARRYGWIAKIPLRKYGEGAYVSRPSVRSNLSPKPVWRSMIWKGRKR
jgi:hypothetical protein